MKGKKLISILHQLLKYLLYINIVLAGGVVGFQIINFFMPEKALTATYLGKFVIELNAAGHGSLIGNAHTYFDTISGMASLAIDSKWHQTIILLFSVLVGMVTLVYNFLFYKIFKALNFKVKSSAPFTAEISKYLMQVSWFSILVFAIGSVLSIAKVLIVKQVLFNNFVARPVFDNWLLNFLWFGVGMYILNEIYKVGIELKKEQELTI